MENAYRAPGGLFFQVLLLGFASVLLASAIGGGAAPLFIAFAVVFVVAAVYALLMQPYKIILDESNVVTFHGIVRRRAVPVAEVHRVKHLANGEGISLKFVFSRGSITVTSWPRFNALADELCKRNPSIERDD